MLHTIKIRLYSILRKMGINLVLNENFTIYKTVVDCNEKGVKVPFLNYIIVSNEVYTEYKKIYSQPFSLENLPAQESLPDTPLLDWHTDKDSLRIKESALDYRAELSSNQYAKTYRNKLLGRIAINNGRGFWRIETMRQLRKENPSVFKGKVLEVGAGTGFISSLLSAYSEVSEVYSLDYDRYTVENLMPLVQWSLGAETQKITRIIGSYNEMEAEDDTFDVVVAVGAMHHSEDVRATFRECFRVLKPGGKFIISDYVLDDCLSQEEFAGMMNMPLNEKDVESILNGQDSALIKTNRSISEHGRPAYTYLSAAFDAGFNIQANFFDATTETGGYIGLVYRYSKALIKSLTGSKVLIHEKRKRVFGYDYFGNVKSFALSKEVKYPYYAKNTPNLFTLLLRGKKAGMPIYDNMVLLLEKPVISHIPQFTYKFRNGKTYQFPVKLSLNNK